MGFAFLSNSVSTAAVSARYVQSLWMWLMQRRCFVYRLDCWRLRGFCCSERGAAGWVRAGRSEVEWLLQRMHYMLQIRCGLAVVLRRASPGGAQSTQFEGDGVDNGWGEGSSTEGVLPLFVKPAAPGGHGEGWNGDLARRRWWS